MSSTSSVISAATWGQDHGRTRGHGSWAASGLGLGHFALRNLASRPVRTMLALVGLAVPVLGVLGLFCLSDGIRNLVGETLAQVEGILVLRENAPTDLFSELPSKLDQSLRRVPGVRVVAPQIWKFAPSIEERSQFFRTRAGSKNSFVGQPLQGLLDLVQIEGQDIAEHARLRSSVYRRALLPADRGGGRFLEQSDLGQRHAVISASIASQYPDAQGRPRSVGDEIRIGREPFRIVGIYQTGSILLDSTIVMDINTARRLLSISDETVSCFFVEASDPSRAEAVAEAIERSIPGVDARTMSDFAVGIGQLLSRVDQLLFLVISLALLVGTVGIVNTMLMSTSERLAEFGIMRSNGWSRGDVLRLVMVESALLGLLAGWLACLVAEVLATLLNRLLDQGLRLDLSPGLLGLGLCLSVVLGTLGGIYPGWKVSKLSPLETIRVGSR